MCTYVPISPPSYLSLPSSLSHPSRWSQSTELISLYYVAASHELSILHLVVCICQCYSHFAPAYPSPSVCPQIHSLCQHLYSCSAPRFFWTIFFFFRFHVYVLAYSICFPLLTYFTLYDSLYLHPPHYK